MKKIARKEFLKIIGISMATSVFQILPSPTAYATDGKKKLVSIDDMDAVQEAVGTEKEAIEAMLMSGELTRADLNEQLLSLKQQAVTDLQSRGYSESQIDIIKEYNESEDAFDYLYTPDETTGAMRSNATVRFLYGLAGNEGTRAVTIAYDIKWSERPILAYTDSFGIGWIAANENSIEVVTKVDDVTGEIAYFYSATEDSALLYSDVNIDTSKNGVVICTAPLLNHADTSTYGKHISGIINISTQSDSNNIDTVQIYVAYAHTTVKATFDWEVSLDFDKIGMSISFIPQPRTTIIAEGHATFWYNSQDFEVAPNV